MFVSADGSIWGNTIASGTGSGQLITISFATQSARYIKVVLTTNSSKWWSIQEFNISGASGVLNRSGWTASASSSNLVPSNVFDGDPVTRWSTQQAQTAGNWFLVDMGSIQHFSGITLDNGIFMVMIIRRDIKCLSLPMVLTGVMRLLVVMAVGHW